MKMIISHGDKGGVGKSTVGMVLTEHAIHSYGSDRLLLVEGDATIPDLAERYRGYVSGVAVGLNRPGRGAEKAIADLFEELERTEAELVIVNLPGSASETLDPMAADLIAPTIEALGVDLAVLYALGPDRHGADAARESAKSGLASIAHRKVAVRNAHMGDLESFAFREKNSGYDHVVTLPPLTEHVAAAVRQTSEPLHVLLDFGAEMSVVNRTILRRWLNAAAPIAEAAFGGVEVEPAGAEG